VSSARSSRRKPHLALSSLSLRQAAGLGAGTAGALYMGMFNISHEGDGGGFGLVADGVVAEFDRYHPPLPLVDKGTSYVNGCFFRRDEQLI